MLNLLIAAALSYASLIGRPTSCPPNLYTLPLYDQPFSDLSISGVEMSFADTNRTSAYKPSAV